jgi:dipeptidyl aminopeptidase/acylaminoacyl peptidase
MRLLRWLILAATFVSVFAKAEPPPLEAYGKLPDLASPRLSPSGRRLATIATIEGTRRLMVIETDGKLVMQTAVSDVTIRDLRWAGENYVVAITSSTQNLGIEYGFRHELYNAIALDLEHHSFRLLIDSSNREIFGAAFGFYGVVQRQGRWLAFVGALPLLHNSHTNHVMLAEDTEPQLTSIDLGSGEIKREAAGYGKNQGWLIDTNGKVLANDGYEATKKKWSLYAGDHRDRLLIESNDRFGDNALLGQGRTAGTALYVMHDEDGGAHYMEEPLSGVNPAIEILRDSTVQSFIHDPATGLLVGVVKETDSPSPEMFDEHLQSNVHAARAAFSDRTVQFASWSDDFSRFLVLTEGMHDSGTLWLIDIGSANAKPLGSAYPGIGRDQVGAFRMVSYKAADGLDLTGILTLPPGRDPHKLPLVVLPHGGPEARDYPHFDWWAQAFASRGYAVWQPNFRGSSGYGLAFRNAGFGEWGRKMQTDISDGVTELERQGIVDPKRSCIVGGSYGGYAALAGITVQQGLYRCAVSVAGVADLSAMLRTELKPQYSNADLYWDRFMGAKDFTDKSLDAYSPIRLAARADAPVLLIHGRDDTVVNYEQSTTMRSALKSAGKPVELVTLAGEDHHLSHEQTRVAMLQAAVAFVQKYNPPDAP